MFKQLRLWNYLYGKHVGFGYKDFRAFPHSGRWKMLRDTFFSDVETYEYEDCG